MRNVASLWQEEAWSLGVIPTPFSQYLTEEQHEVKERDGWDGEAIKTEAETRGMDSPAISYRDLSLPQSMNPNVGFKKCEILNQSLSEAIGWTTTTTTTPCRGALLPTVIYWVCGLFRGQANWTLVVNLAWVCLHLRHALKGCLNLFLPSSSTLNLIHRSVQSKFY